MPDLPKLYDEAQTRWWMRHVVIGALSTRTALAEGRIAGFASLCEFRLEHLYVHPGMQGRGIGRRLLDAARADVAELRLRVFQSNIGARRFYERAGFELEALCDGSDNEEGVPDAVYLWRRSAEPQRT
ncbi:GNAT family N-acetyltransferase [Salinarimonas sp. NSM]|uniref:GNAT family N-acetyltransferase n=1 Tax=Salinarimonas sp. NSM TaxID=3458003 RepID=UPI004035BF08